MLTDGWGLFLFLLETWTSIELKPSSYLSSITSLLPSFSTRSHLSSPLQPNEIIALSSYSQEDALNLAFSLSRDRKLRVWNILTGVCARTVDLSTGINSSGSEDGGIITEGGNGSEGPRSFIKVIYQKPSGASTSSSSSFKYNNQMETVSSSSWKSTFHLVIYLPPSSPAAPTSSGLSKGTAPNGKFVTYRITVDTQKGSVSDPSFVGVRLASPPSSLEGGRATTGGVELRDFEVLLGKPGETDDAIWAVWDLKGQTVIQRASLGRSLSSPGAPSSAVALWETDDEGALGGGGWETLRDVLEPQTGFTAEYFDDLISSFSSAPSSPEGITRETLSSIFTTHLFFPSRFAPTSLQKALESYTQTIQSLPSTSHNQALSTSYPSLSAKVGAVVGSHLAAGISPQTGEVMHAEFIRKLKIEWLGFLARVEEGERDARWGVGIVKVGSAGEDASGVEEGVVVVERDGFVLPVQGGEGDRLALRVVNGGGSSGKRPEEDLVGFLKVGWDVVEGFSPSARNALENELDQLVAAGGNCPIEDACLDIFEGRIAPFLSDESAEHVSRQMASFFLGQGRKVDVVELVRVGLEYVKESKSGVQSGLALSALGISFLDESLRVSLEWRFGFVLNLLVGLVLALDQVTSTEEMGEEDNEKEALREALPSLILSTLAVYQKLGALRWLARTISLDNSGANDSFGGDLGLLERFDSLHVNHSSLTNPSSNALPLPSLLLALLQSAPTSIALPLTSTLTSISSCTASFLRTTSLPALRTIIPPSYRTTSPPITSSEPVNAWEVYPQDGKLALALLETGHPEHAIEFVERFAKDEGLAFVEAKARLVLGQVDESEELFERLSGAFGEIDPVLWIRSIILV